MGWLAVGRIVSRRRQRTEGRAHLWHDTPDGGVTVGEVRDNPRLRPCPWPPCSAAPGKPCTVRTRHGGRRALTHYHDARTETTT